MSIFSKTWICELLFMFSININNWLIITVFCVKDSLPDNYSHLALHCVCFILCLFWDLGIETHLLFDANRSLQNIKQDVSYKML